MLCQTALVIEDSGEGSLLPNCRAFLTLQIILDHGGNGGDGGRLLSIPTLWHLLLVEAGSYFDVVLVLYFDVGLTTRLSTVLTGLAAMAPPIVIFLSQALIAALVIVLLGGWCDLRPAFASVLEGFLQRITGVVASISAAMRHMCLAVVRLSFFGNSGNTGPDVNHRAPTSLILFVLY